jgi:hypothetical protein
MQTMGGRRQLLFIRSIDVATGFEVMDNMIFGDGGALLQDEDVKEIHINTTIADPLLSILKIMILT